MIGRVAWYYARSLRTYNLSRTGLEALQTKMLRRLMRVAFEKVPHYHAVFKEMGTSPADFDRLESFRAFPILSKSEAARAGTALTASGTSMKYIRTGSGTSGTAFSAVYDQPWRDMATALQGRRLTKFGVKPWNRLVSVWAPKKYWRKAQRGPRRGEPMTLIDEIGPIAVLGRLSTRVAFLEAAQDDPARDLRELRRLRPDFIMGRASHLLRMGDSVPKDAGRIAQGINCVVEGFTDVAARRIEAAYGAKVFHTYGSNEGGALGAECRFQRGMHLNEDWTLCEVVKDGEPVGPGERGEVVITTFLNETMPLIRYATGDTVELADGDRCECGSSLARVRKMLGRRGDWVKTADGSSIPAFDLAEEIEAAFGLKDYQLIQKRIGEFLAKTQQPDVDEAALGAQLRSLLSERIGVEVALTFAEQPREDLWLKNRPIVSEAKA